MIMLLASHLPSNAQNGEVNLKRKISIPAGNIRFDSLLHLIRRQTGIKFSVNTRKYPPSRMIPIGKRTLPLEDLLEVIHSRSGIYYTVLGAHIIFVDTPPQQANAVHRSQAPVTVGKAPVSIMSAKKGKAPVIKPPESKQPVVKPPQVKRPVKSPSLLTMEALPPASPQMAVVVTGLEHVSFISYKKNLTAGDSIPLVTLSSDSIRVDKAPQTGTSLIRSAWEGITSIRLPALGYNEQKRTGRRAVFNPEIKPGITADETFYMNPIIQAGWPFLYGIVSWSSNFKVAGLRYGGGVSARIADNWRLHLAVTTGKLEKSYDTSGFIIQGKSTLNRVALRAEKPLNEKWCLQFGVAYAMLRTAYYQNGTLTPPFISENEVKREVNPINPIYTIGGRYTQDGAVHHQTWIGFQIGIFYRINFSRHNKGF
ncbi:hypothetical protein [Chitinophaga arvensicola]|uniref:Uncharacterized protein n=1 Tax=Chitinophaga arvensicola TaxID=29529 RepID=A0A1I0RAD7_9BACT|nr:hypothetical protein [Chitinophaga arvensicola]SEW37753.1 hypothetical protein SAMN04488122_2542 [Chitinophaga arvensicola]